MMHSLLRKSGTKLRPSSVSVLDVRPESVPKIRDWFARSLESLAESKAYICAVIPD